MYIIQSTTFFGHAVVPPSPAHLSPIVSSNPSLLYQPETQVSGFVACFSLQDVFPASEHVRAERMKTTALHLK